MGHVFNCLNAPNVCKSVLDMVMEMADNLLGADQKSTGEDLMETEESRLGEFSFLIKY